MSINFNNGQRLTYKPGRCYSWQ